MDDAQGLPGDIDPDLWFECRHYAGARDYVLREPWHTFPGRMAAWCETQRVSFRVSKSELPETLPDTTRYWVDGFLVGNVPRQPDADDVDGPAVTEWRVKAEKFLDEGAWPSMSDLKWQWFEDSLVLTEIGHVKRPRFSAVPIRGAALG